RRSGRIAGPIPRPSFLLRCRRLADRGHGWLEAVDRRLPRRPRPLRVLPIPLLRDGLQLAGPPEGLPRPRVAPRPPGRVRCLPELRGIPAGEGLADLRHALRAFVEE